MASSQNIRGGAPLRSQMVATMNGAVFVAAPQPPRGGWAAWFSRWSPTMSGRVSDGVLQIRLPWPVWIAIIGCAAAIIGSGAVLLWRTRALEIAHADMKISIEAIAVKLESTAYRTSDAARDFRVRDETLESVQRRLEHLEQVAMQKASGNP